MDISSGDQCHATFAGSRNEIKKAKRSRISASCLSDRSLHGSGFELPGNGVHGTKGGVKRMEGCVCLVGRIFKSVETS